MGTALPVVTAAVVTARGAVTVSPRALAIRTTRLDRAIRRHFMASTFIAMGGGRFEWCHDGPCRIAPILAVGACGARGVVSGQKIRPPGVIILPPDLQAAAPAAVAHGHSAVWRPLKGATGSDLWAPCRWDWCDACREWVR